MQNIFCFIATSAAKRVIRIIALQFAASGYIVKKKKKLKKNCNEAAK